jgi:hypothetical protein
MGYILKLEKEMFMELGEPILAAQKVRPAETVKAPIKVGVNIYLD